MTVHHDGHSSEEDSLLPKSSDNERQRGRNMFGRFSWNPHPYWLIPVVLLMSMSRGVTMSPRIQVYKAIACRNIIGDGDSLSELLLRDACDGPEVRAKQAKIHAAVVTTMSALSAISTGFWSRLSDRVGRKPILVTFLSGALIMEAVFILVMRGDSIPGRYAERFILLGPIVEGLVGGLSTFNGTVHAYISDCTRHGSRSKIFSTVQGMIFVGLAIGPWLDGFFLPVKGYDDRFFIGSIALITLTIAFVLFGCPEARKPETTSCAEIPVHDSFSLSPYSRIKSLLVSFTTALILPFTMFRPRRSPLGGMSWNMTLCGMALFLYIVSTGLYAAKYIYASDVFKWDTVELGYYMSVLWVCRAVNLLILLPLILSYLKPKSITSKVHNPNPRELVAELAFDTRLAQISLAVDGLADFLVAVTQSRSPGVFYVLSCLSSFTSGGNPALHSLGAICLHACGLSSQTGALFGAMGVLSAAAHIISPSIYAFTYAATVARYPEAIFVLGTLLLAVSVTLLFFLSTSEEEVALAQTPRIGDDRASEASSSYQYQSIPGARDSDEELTPR